MNLNNNILWKKKPKIIVVMPAYNAELTLEKTYKDLPHDLISEVILVDDLSKDDTVKKAKEMGLTIYTHKMNLGYGGNQKTCYKEALKRNPDIVVMVHPDYQYDATLTGILCEPIVNGRADIMLGSRIQTRSQVLSGGMPYWKYVANRFLTLIENLVTGLNLAEYHTGFRAYKADVLKKLPLEKFSDDFVFDQQILISAISDKFVISQIPVPCRYFKEASSINFKRSSIYGLSTLYLLLLYLLNLTGLHKSKIFN